MKKYYALFLISFALWVYKSYLHKDELKIDLPKTLDYIEIKEYKEDNSTSTEEVIEKSINLDIPFTSQAPTANWDEPFQNACEEASILMVDYYYNNKELPSNEEIENIFLDMVKWQEDNWGEHSNLPILEVSNLVKELFGYNTEIVNDLNEEKIESYLDNGYPITIPANGKLLDNPNFNNGGPEYHMLVIKGYVDDKYITNDPGTRNGADFIYTKENLLESIADWDNEKSHTDMGLKNGLIIYFD